MPLVDMLISIDTQSDGAVKAAQLAILHYFHAQLNPLIGTDGELKYNHIVDPDSSEIKITGRQYTEQEKIRLINLFESEYQNIAEAQKKFKQLINIADFFEQQLLTLLEKYKIDAPQSSMILKKQK